MNTRTRSDRTSARAARVAASSLLALSALCVGVGSTLAAGGGSIWTTNDPCSNLAAQNTNVYAAGDMVYVRGDGFAAVTGFGWTITGQPGGGSGDPGAVVASGSGSTDGAGVFCLAAYVVAADDWGVYSVDVSQGRTSKADNYRVDAAAPTPEPTPEPTVEPTAAPTPEPTAELPVEPTPAPVVEPTPAPVVEPTPDPAVEPPAAETVVDPTDPPADPPADETVVDPTDPTDLNQSVLGDVSTGGGTELPATDAASDVATGASSIFLILGLAGLAGAAVLFTPIRRREAEATE